MEPTVGQVLKNRQLCKIYHRIIYLYYSTGWFVSFHFIHNRIAVHSKQKQTSNKPFIPKHSILVSCVNDIGYSETRLG